MFFVVVNCARANFLGVVSCPIIFGPSYSIIPFLMFPVLLGIFRAPIQSHISKRSIHPHICQETRGIDPTGLVLRGGGGRKWAWGVAWCRRPEISWISSGGSCWVAELAFKLDLVNPSNNHIFKKLEQFMLFLFFCFSDWGDFRFGYRGNLYIYNCVLWMLAYLDIVDWALMNGDSP